MSEGKKEQDSYETLADIEVEIGDKSDFCHNNVLSKGWDDWEQMHEWLLAIRRRIEAARRRELNTNSKSAQVEFCYMAKMREALEAVKRVGYPHNFQREAYHIRSYCEEITAAIRKCMDALAAIEKGEG